MRPDSTPEEEEEEEERGEKEREGRGKEERKKERKKEKGKRRGEEGGRGGEGVSSSNSVDKTLSVSPSNRAREGSDKPFEREDVPEEMAGIMARWAKKRIRR